MFFKQTIVILGGLAWLLSASPSIRLGYEYEWWTRPRYIHPRKYYIPATVTVFCRFVFLAFVMYR